MLLLVLVEFQICYYQLRFLGSSIFHLQWLPACLWNSFSCCCGLMTSSFSRFFVPWTLIYLRYYVSWCRSYASVFCRHAIYHVFYRLFSLRFSFLFWRLLMHLPPWTPVFLLSVIGQPEKREIKNTFFISIPVFKNIFRGLKIAHIDK